MRSRPDLRPYVTRCRHCRIFFLVHPRNQGRRDLGCAFGCRAAQRKKRSAERSVAYYQTPAGKKKKARLNSRRRRAGDPGSDAVQETAEVELCEVESRDAELGEAEATEFGAEIVEHVRVVVSLIEGFEVGREETVAMLARAKRQHRIVHEKRLDYFLDWLAANPP